jgi:SagB-type dehydrogenase family enzyme
MAKTTIFHPTEIGSLVNPPDPSLSEIFHENTKLHAASLPNAKWASAQYSFDELAAMANARKSYHSLPSIGLAYGERPDPSFQSVVQHRRTVRRFDPSPMSFEALSWILDVSYGVTSEGDSHSSAFAQRYRAAPSAGALYPAEIYLYARKVAQLAEGLYHYSPEIRVLTEICAGEQVTAVWQACCEQDYAKQAAATIFITGVFERTKSKYGERGYRYVLLDIGHLGENLCLATTASGLAMMTTCGFFDDDVNRLLGVDGLNEAVVYVAFLGPKADDRAEGVRTD